ncbi:hypothetical protein V8J82_23525 [Gymnodinialimonas sp. 2305UL16-5]|uniref:hypothetical protein n=1 Tax=Gymnodinialimonas mytili TaxID=3126503 RepID=UPI00309F2BC7
MAHPKAKTEVASRSGVTMACLTTGLCLGVGLAAAQTTGEGGALFTLDLSNGASFETNSSGENETVAQTNVTLGLSSVTHRSRFEFSFGTGYEIRDDGESGFTDPNVSGAFGLFSRSSTLDLSFSRTETDIDGDVIIEDPVFGPLLIEDDGSREQSQIALNVATGIDAPLGFEGRLSRNQVINTGTSDPDLIDRTTLSYGGTIRMDVHPRISLRLNADRTETEEEGTDPTDREITRYGVNADIIVDPLWQARAGLSFDEIRTEQTVLGVTTVEVTDGIGIQLGAERTFRNGTLDLSYSREIERNGARDTFRVTRALDLPQGAALSWSLGLAAFENGDVSPLSAVSYTRPTPRGNFSFGLSQTGSVNADDDNIINTRLNAAYNAEINSRSSWSIDSALITNTSVSGTTGDVQRRQFGLGYNYALTQDWDLSARFSHRVTTRDDADDTRSNRVSLNLQRSFTFRP